jgi:hypothetical protein
MASPVRTLTVNFVGKTKDLDKAFKRVSKGSSLMSDRMARAASIGMGAFAGIGAAVAGAVMTLKPMVEGAAAVAESLAKNRVLFGDAAAAAERFAEGSAEAFGISRREALEAVGVFGSLAHAMGMPQAEGVDLSVTMTKLAADMASFNNVSVEETLTALQAGLRGEAEPLRRFGVLLDAATLKAKALEEGLIENEKKALTPQVKALAAYRLILEQTVVQQGDFEKTSDGLASQTKKLAASFDDIKDSIGEGLLPVVTDVVTAFNDELLPSIKAFWEDPSVATSAREAGKMYWRVFGEGVEEAAAEDGEGGRGFWVRVFTPPAFILAGALQLGVDWIGQFQEGMREERIAQELQGIFDRAALQLDIDWEEFFNVEAMGVREEFVVEGWQPDVVPGFGAGPPNAGYGPSLGGFSAADIQGTGPGLEAIAAAQAANLAAEAQLEEMNEALADAQQGQLDVADAFADLLSEMEDLRLVGMGAGDITGTGPGLIEVANAQIEAAEALTRAAEAAEAATADRKFIEAAPAKVDEMADLGTWLTGPGAQAGIFGAAPAVNVTINAPAVTGKEVIDAMAEAVKIGGPMSRQWIGQ